MTNHIEFNTYKDKVLGGWVGKCAGGILGAPIEGFKKFNNIPFSQKLFETNFPNDDLDLQILWLDMVLKKGHKVREEDFKAHWHDHVEFPWCEYGIARRNIVIGLDNPDTGSHNNEYWHRGMGSPIRSEIWGMPNPGMPEKAAFYAGIDSRVDHYGFSVNAEQYLSACMAIAFFESDIKKILFKGLEYIEPQSDCHKLVEQVIEWDAKYDFDIVAGKIKSLYGDADFTSAPLNVAFTILSLLHTEKSFDFLIDALHLGHDSDCIVATAGALLGVVLGYKNIPEIWKEMVGNELLVSPGIVNMYCPKTLDELAELTCKASLSFVEDSSDVKINNIPKDTISVENGKQYSVHCQTLEFPNPIDKKAAEIAVFYENLTAQEQTVSLIFKSPYFESQSTTIKVAKKESTTTNVKLNFNEKKFPSDAISIAYTLQVTINEGEVDTIEKGFPYYGTWLLLGPFIEDDTSLAKSDFKYPDHGLSTQPSVKYMNRDKRKPSVPSITTASIEQLLKEGSILDQKFHAEVITPDAMRIRLDDYFYGRGERALFLYTEVQSPNAAKKWLAMGSNSYIKVWHNGIEVYEEADEIIRSYPIAHAVEVNLKKGKNTFLIKLDNVIDDYMFEVGLKDHDDKHPHQTLWNTDLQFDIINHLKK